MILDLNSRLANLTHFADAGDCCRPDIGVGDDGDGVVEVDDDLYKIVFVLIQNLTNLLHRKSLLALLLVLLTMRRSTMEDDVAEAAAVAVVAVVLLLL